MTASDYRAAVSRLGLSLVAAGHWLGSERSSRRWAAEGAPRSVEVALLLALDKWDNGYTLDEIKAVTAPESP